MLFSNSEKKLLSRLDCFFSLPNVANNEKREVHVVLSGGLQQTSENTFFLFLDMMAKRRWTEH